MESEPSTPATEDDVRVPHDSVDTVTDAELRVPRDLTGALATGGSRSLRRASHGRPGVQRQRFRAPAVSWRSVSACRAARSRTAARSPSNVCRATVVSDSPDPQGAA